MGKVEKSGREGDGSNAEKLEEPMSTSGRKLTPNPLTLTLRQQDYTPWLRLIFVHGGQPHSVHSDCAHALKKFSPWSCDQSTIRIQLFSCPLVTC